MANSRITKRILIGGSGSTGSSLLKNILNRHPSIYAGVETSLFCKKQLFQNWNGAKSRILKKGFWGLRNYSWHIYNGTDLLNNEYGYNEDEVHKMILKAHSFQAFSDDYFGRRMIEEGKQVWCEKTPANAFCLNMFLHSFDQSSVIHMVRNPYDTIASLVSRGFNVYYATGIYLLNTASALVNSNHDHYHEVKYEDLTNDTTKTLQKLYAKLEIPFHEDDNSKEPPTIEVTQLKGWHHDETAPIANTSVGRFEQLSKADQMNIIHAVERILISPQGCRYFKTEIKSVKEICKQLGYKYKTSGNSVSPYLSQLRRADMWRRTVRTYPTGFWNYPLQLREI